MFSDAQLLIETPCGHVSKVFAFELMSREETAAISVKTNKVNTADRATYSVAVDHIKALSGEDG